MRPNNQKSGKAGGNLSLVSGHTQANEQIDQTQDLFEQGIVCHRTGKLKEAKNLYEQTLLAQPDHVDAMHLMGLIAYETANFDLAEHLMQGAIALNPNNSSYHSNLGNVLKAKQKFWKTKEIFQ